MFNKLYICLLWTLWSVAVPLESLALSNELVVSAKEEPKGDAKKEDKKDTKEGEEEEEQEPEYDEDCPPAPSAPESRATPLAEEQADPNKDIADVGTKIVINDFFATTTTYFNFLKISLEGLENALIIYGSEKGIEESAFVLLLKGGNLMRMIAKRTFAYLPLEAGSLLQNEYGKYFNRSDTDFTVYIDPKKIGTVKFQEVFDGLSDQLFMGIDYIRNKLASDPAKSFDLFALEKEEADKKLGKAFGSLQGIDAVKDPENKRWYKARFTQLQILELRGNEAGPTCPYRGQFDFKYEIKDNESLSEPMSKEPNWLANSLRRNLEIPWGIDPAKKYKMALLRIKAIFDYAIEILGKDERRSVGGELLDISVVHEEDDSVKEFLEKLEENVANYTISNKATGEKLALKGYSVPYLGHDLLAILFETFDRPWKSGDKYEKRLNRFFFFSILELLGNYGLGSLKIADYVAMAQNEFLAPMEAIVAPEKGNKTLAKSLKNNVDRLEKIFPELKATIAFWRNLAEVVGVVMQKPEEGDFEALAELVATVKGNLETSKKLAVMPFYKVDIEALYKVDIRDAF